MSFSVPSRLPWLLLVIVQSALGGNIAGLALNDTLNLAFLIPWTGDVPIGSSTAAGFTLGIQEVHNRQLLPGYTVDWQFRDTWCKPQQGFKMAVEMWSETEDLDAIIGAACSVVCQPVAVLAAYWNIPSVSYAATSGLLSDKSMYPTFTRTVGTWIANVPTMSAFLDVFGWGRVGLITSTQDLWRNTAEATQADMERNNITVIFRTIESTIEGQEVKLSALDRAKSVMRAMKEEARIIFLYMYPPDSRNLLVIAMEEDMLEGYLYISLDHESGPQDAIASYRPEIQEGIWTGFISMDPLKPSGPEYDAFTQEVIDEFQDPVWDGYPVLPANASTSDVSVYAGFLYDAVLLWAYGVNRTLQAGGTPDDGMNITRNIFNLTFPGITGNVAINDVGERLVDQVIQIYQDGVYVPLLIWRASEGRMEIVYGNHSDGAWGGIVWPGGSTAVPLGYPACGWSEELCPTEDVLGTPAIIGIAFAVAVVIAAMVGSIFVFYRYRAMRNAALASCIRWDEVNKVCADNNPKKSMASFTSARLFDTMSQTTMNAVESEHQAGTTHRPREIYMCRNQVVKLNKLPSFESGMNEDMLAAALSKLVVLTHESIVAFIGFVLDSPEKYVVTETTDRSNMYDLIDGEEIDLTLDFKMSLLLDAANGMNYLHQSFLKYHGNLNSKCCFLDSKFACKIGNYWMKALPLYHGGDTKLDIEDRLWMAPEVLQHNSLSDKCDVYSFGIIVQEVLLRDKPYAANVPPLNAQEIVKQVAESDRNYRPTLSGVSPGWKALCEQCWAGDASMRPTFAKILQMLVKLNGGRKVNVVDSMFKRMEAHTTRLEEIVQQRSLELMDEKGKTEDLICELLPRSVFEQMSLGKQVEPETFEEVTMFFSDIEGFTKIASAAGPMDIISLLNRLYMIFDAVLVKYDVYKVATIGDAYIVVSGLPVRNGNRHAGEIAAMSLELINSITDFEIGHMPGKFLRMRVGLHTGSCVGAVTGIKMPRYLLFGDMVNTGTRIEALGEAMRAHVSDTTTRLLQGDRRFTMIARDEVVDIPGHGTMQTFWLDGAISAA